MKTFVPMENPDLAFLRGVGLTELHTHVGFSVSPTMLWEIAHDQGILLPTKDYWEFEKLITIHETKNYDEYLKMYDWTEQIQSSPESLFIAMQNSISGAYRKNNITKIELRYNPMLRNRGGERDLDHLIVFSLQGMERAMLKYPVRAGVILMMDRRFPVETNAIIVKKAIKYRHRGVVGIDLGGPINLNEHSRNFKPRHLRSLVEEARRHGLGFTIHTGEVTDTSEMWESIEELNPDRIGHGVVCVNDPALMSLLARRHIVLETCPTSNLNTRVIKDDQALKHLYSKLLEYNVPFTINTDGPEMQRISLRDEFAMLLRKGILDEEALLKSNRIATAASFIRDREPSLQQPVSLAMPLLIQLRSKAEESRQIPLYLTYDDVLLLPMPSSILPGDTNVSTTLTNGIKLGMPFLAAPMDTVCESALAIAIWRLGGMGFLHRNMSVEEQMRQYALVREAGCDAGIAIGVGDDCNERLSASVESGVRVICIDSAHGHSAGIISLTASIRSQYSQLQIIAGNVVTYEAACELYEAGADAIRVGVGPGSICTTRVIAGVGAPQLTAVWNVARAAKQYKRYCIADGGIKTSGDIVKALAAGASTVMLGSLLAGTQEAPGELVVIDGRKYKRYRGMGSLGAMALGSAQRYGFSSIDEKRFSPQGVEGLVPYCGTVEEKLSKLLNGLQAGMGYIGASVISEMPDKAQFIQTTQAGLAESHPHSIRMEQFI